jgi:uncharacterized protein (DUF58 family)
VNLSSLEQNLKSSLTPRRGETDRRARPAPRPAPVRKPGRAVRRGNRLTGEGTLFILLTLLIGMASVNSGHNLLYLVFSVMLAMLLLSGILARANLRGIAVQRRYPLEFHCNRPVPATIEVRNNKRLFSSYVLRVHDTLIPEGPYAGKRQPTPVAVFAAMVRPGQTVRCSVGLIAPRRGLYRLESLQVRSRYPFSFFQRSMRLYAGGQLLVYPPLLPTRLLPTYVSAAVGDRDGDRQGSGVSLYGIRNYQSGDPARLIHWKQSAKGQGIKLKEFEEETARAFRLILDLRCADPEAADADPYFEMAISTVASLARYLLQRNCSVALWTSYGRISMGMGRVQLQRVMRALARVSPQPWGVEIPFMDNDAQEVATFWVTFQDPQDVPSAADRGFRRPPNTRIIDVRRLPSAEPDTAKPAATETAHGN